MTQVAFARSSGATGANSGTSLSMSVTTGVNDNFLLVILSVIADNQTPTVTFNGISLTKHYTYLGFLHMFYLRNPPVGAYTLTASWQTSATCTLESASYSGAGALGPPLSLAGGTNWLRATGTTPVDGCIVGGIFVNGYPIYPDAGVNARAARVQNYMQTDLFDWFATGTNQKGYSYAVGLSGWMIACTLSPLPPSSGNQVIWWW